MCFVGLNPIIWSSKRQGAIETSSYSAEFCSGRVAMEEVILLRYLLRSLGIPAKGPTELCVNNQGMIISSANSDSELKKNHVAISYHKLREISAAGIVNPIKVCITVN